jgi:hypothetical protein
MSLTSDDLIWIPIEPALLHAAAARTARGLLFIPNRRPRPTPWQLRQRSSVQTAELLVRRWLDHERAPYQLDRLAPVTEPHRRVLVLGGRQAAVVARFLPSPRQVDRLEDLLGTRVPTAFQGRSEGSLRKGDVMIFAFLVPAPRTVDDRTETYLAVWPPGTRTSRPLPRRFLYIRSGSRDAVDLEVAGIAGGRKLAIGHMDLPPFAHVPVDPAHQLLLYLHPAVRPAGELELGTEGSGSTWTVAPRDWADLCPPLSAGILAGWTTSGSSRHGQSFEGEPMTAEDRRRASTLPARDLRPMRELTERLRHTKVDSQRLADGR